MAEVISAAIGQNPVDFTKTTLIQRKQYKYLMNTISKHFCLLFTNIETDTELLPVNYY